MNNFLWTTQSEERVSALAILSAGNNLLESSSNFSEKATEAFVLREERRIDFTYKEIEGMSFLLL
jgi:hypothetical protein